MGLDPQCIANTECRSSGPQDHQCEYTDIAFAVHEHAAFYKCLQNTLAVHCASSKEILQLHIALWHIALWHIAC